MRVKSKLNLDATKFSIRGMYLLIEIVQMVSKDSGVDTGSASASLSARSHERAADKTIRTPSLARTLAAAAAE